MVRDLIGSADCGPADETLESGFFESRADISRDCYPAPTSSFGRLD